MQGFATGPILHAGRSRRAAMLAASLTFHAIALTLLALGPGVDRRPARDVPPWPVPLHVQLEPRPVLRGEKLRLRPPAAAGGRPIQAPSPRTARASLDPAPPTAPDRPSPPLPRAVSPSVSSAPPAAGSRGVQPVSPDAGIGRSLRLGAAGCRTLDGRLTLDEQAVCDNRFASAAARAPAVAGTDDPVRDARFAAQGAAALAAYDERRATLKPPRPCPGADLMGRCPVVINIPLFSSLVGFLPGLGDDDE